MSSHQHMNLCAPNSFQLVSLEELNPCIILRYLGIYAQGEGHNTGYLSLYMYLDAPDSDPPLEPGPAVDVVLSIVDQKYGVNNFRKSLGSFDIYVSPACLFDLRVVDSCLITCMCLCCRGVALCRTGGVSG